MRKTILLILSCCLTACQSPRVLNDYLMNPPETQRQYELCRLGQQVEQCPLVAQAMQQLVSHAFVIQTNPQEFGKRVMAVQIEITVLKTLPADPQNKQKLQRATDRYAQYLAWIRWLNQ